MNKFTAIIFVFFTMITEAQNCNERVEEIFDSLIESIGNYSMPKPEFHISRQMKNVAKMNRNGVTIEQFAIDLFCGDNDFDDKVSYILAHELAHYYNKHTWMRNTGLGYASSIQEVLDSIYYTKAKRKESEIQADLYAGFYGQISGYNTLEKAIETLTVLYDEYGFPRENPKYPSFNERIDIINSKIKIANDLALLFELGNVLLLDKKYNKSEYSYKYILREEFNSREIHNNLGLSYLLHGISVSKEPISSLLFPLSLDQTTRAEVAITRSGSIHSAKKLIQKASKEFDWAIRLDPNYKKAMNNNIVCEFLLIEGYDNRTHFLNNQLGLDPKFIADLEVINMIISKKKTKKTQRLAKKGSEISQLNTSITADTNKIIDKDIFLRKLELSPSLIRRKSASRLHESDFQSFFINDIQILKDPELFIIKLPERILNNDTFSNEEKKQLVKTLKGTYYIYEWD